MLHASSDEDTELWTPDASRVDAGQARQILESYLNEWRQLALELGGDAHLLDEEFVGGEGAGMPQSGRVIPRSGEYFHRFYDARAAFGPVVKALCKVRTRGGTCADDGSAGTLEPMGLWPRPEEQDLLTAIMALEGYLTLGTSLPSAVMPPQTKARMKVGAVVVGVLGMGALIAGIVRRGRM